MSFHAKMASAQEKAQVIGWFSELKSIVRVQTEFYHVHQKAAPDAKRFKAWHNRFLESGGVLEGHGGGRQCVSDDKVENICMAFTQVQGSQFVRLHGHCRYHEQLCIRFSESSCAVVSVCVQGADSAGAETRGIG
jgi:hypothetical protein